MKTQFTLLILAIFLFALPSTAQKLQRKLQKANQHYTNQELNEAISLYLSILDKAEILEAKVNLATIYRKEGNTTEAEYWYSQIVHLPNPKSEWLLYYGIALQANNKCELAKEWFLEYVKREPTDLRVQLLIQFCKETPSNYPFNPAIEIQTLPFSSIFDDFSPVFYQDSLLFLSFRDSKKKPRLTSRIYHFPQPPFPYFYLSEIEVIEFENLEFAYNKIPQRLALNYYKHFVANIIFPFNNDNYFVTIKNIYVSKEGKEIDRYKVFQGNWEKRKMNLIQELPFCSDEYSVAHPTLTSSGDTLYFASDMPNGFGGMDLYYAIREGEFWSPPHNLGKGVNTDNNEIHPYWHDKTQTLYFSSDVPTGYGGFDIYKASKNKDSFKVENILAPINSQGDEFEIILNAKGNFGYLVSERIGGKGGMDIYSFKIISK